MGCNCCGFELLSNPVVGQICGSSPGEVHDIALKAAKTDATRELATFGKPFGLELCPGGAPTSQKPLRSPPVPADARLGFHPDDTTPKTSRYYGRCQNTLLQALRTERRQADLQFLLLSNLRDGFFIRRRPRRVTTMDCPAREQQRKDHCEGCVNSRGNKPWMRDCVISKRGKPHERQRAYKDKRTQIRPFSLNHSYKTNKRHDAYDQTCNGKNATKPNFSDDGDETIGPCDLVRPDGPPSLNFTISNISEKTVSTPRKNTTSSHLVDQDAA